MIRKLLLTFAFAVSCAGVSQNPFYKFGCVEDEALWAVWVWDVSLIKLAKENFERAIKEWGIRRVYVQLGEELDLETVEYLKDLSLEIFVVEGGNDVREVFNPEKAIYLEADGYQIDLEPYTNSDFWVRKAYYLRAYLEKLKEIKERLGGVKFSVVIPHWFDRVEFSRRSLARQVFELADEVVVMAYREKITRALGLVSKEVKLSAKYGKPLILGIEVIYTEGADTIPVSIDELKRLRGLRCRGIEGFALQNIEGIL